MEKGKTFVFTEEQTNTIYTALRKELLRAERERDEHAVRLLSDAIEAVHNQM